MQINQSIDNDNVIDNTRARDVEAEDVIFALYRIPAVNIVTDNNTGQDCEDRTNIK